DGGLMRLTSDTGNAYSVAQVIADTGLTDLSTLKVVADGEQLELYVTEAGKDLPLVFPFEVGPTASTGAVGEAPSPGPGEEGGAEAMAAAASGVGLPLQRALESMGVPAEAGMDRTGLGAFTVDLTRDLAEVGRDVSTSLLAKLRQLLKVEGQELGVKSQESAE